MAASYDHLHQRSATPSIPLRDRVTAEQGGAALDLDPALACLDAHVGHAGQGQVAVLAPRLRLQSVATEPSLDLARRDTLEEPAQLASDQQHLGSGLPRRP